MLEVDVIVSSLQGICWEYHETAAGDEIATQVFKNNVAKVRTVKQINSFFCDVLPFVIAPF